MPLGASAAKILAHSSSNVPKATSATSSVASAASATVSFTASFAGWKDEPIGNGLLGSGAVVGVGVGVEVSAETGV